MKRALRFFCPFFSFIRFTLFPPLSLGMGASASRAAAGRAPASTPPVPGRAAAQAIAEAEARVAASADPPSPPSPPPSSPSDEATAAAAAAAASVAESAAGAELNRILAGSVRARPDPLHAGASSTPPPPGGHQKRKSAPVEPLSSGRLDARALADLLTAAAEGRETAGLLAGHGADPALVAAFLRSARAVGGPSVAAEPPPPPPPGAMGAFDV